VPPRRRRRTDAAHFHLPAERLRDGAFAGQTALRVREAIATADGDGTRVRLQVTAERGGWLAGIDETIAMLRTGVPDWSRLQVHALYDGDKVSDAEPVMTVSGPYADFAHLEPLLPGVLARRTRVCTNARALAEAARPKPVLVMLPEHDHWLTHAGDGAAAALGGAWDLAGDVRPGGRGGSPVITVPHGLIGACGGSTVQAAQRALAAAAADAQALVPVDYENDATRTAVEVARALEGRLWGVRLSTSDHLVDRSILDQMGTFPPAGVNPQLVWNVRNALDAEGLGEVRLVASGDFPVDRMRAFEEDGVPVDAYEVGAALHHGQFDFTADVVEVDGRLHARAGRSATDGARLERVR